MAISRGTPMEDPAPPTPEPDKRALRKQQAKKVGKQAVRLTGREYLPMAFTLAFWAVTALAVGHADAARLLAATVLMRAPAMLTQMTTQSPLRRRWYQAPEVRRQAIWMAAKVQLGVLVALIVEIAALTAALFMIGQGLIAVMLPLVAMGYPAKLYRAVDLRTQSRLFRLYTTGSALAGSGVAWLLGAGPLGFALAFGLREYVGTLLMGLTPGAVKASKTPTDEPLTFAEIARNTVVTARRMMTYRLTKNLLTVFGPFGNFAARTGRGLNMHSRLEPYMPHKRSGFALFSLITAGIAVFLAMRSGKPLAMIAGAGAIQLSALSTCVILWWRYLPSRNDPSLVVEDDEDD